MSSFSSSNSSSVPLWPSPKFRTLTNPVLKSFPFCTSPLCNTGMRLPAGDFTGFPSILLNSLKMVSIMTECSSGQSNGLLPSKESNDWTEAVRDRDRKEWQEPDNEAGLDLTDGTFDQWRGILQDFSRERPNDVKAWSGKWRGIPQTDS